MAKKSSSREGTKEKFLKIIFSFWFWIIVALVSYLIFILIPIQWTGEGLEEVEGTGGLKTFFAYLTQIAWMIVIVIIIVDAIKWIQKTKIGEYWKISFTILGVIGIIAYVFYALSGMGIFDNFSNEYDARIGDLDNEEMIKIHIKLLEKQGYEVLYFGYFDYSNKSFDSAYIKMKSLGSKNEQVWDGLTSLTAVYPDAPKYDIRILEPTQDCWYFIDGKLWKGWSGAEEYTLDGKNVTTLEFFNIINIIIDEEGNCS